MNKLGKFMESMGKMLDIYYPTANKYLNLSTYPDNTPFEVLYLVIEELEEI